MAKISPPKWTKIETPKRFYEILALNYLINTETKSHAARTGTFSL